MDSTLHQGQSSGLASAEFLAGRHGHTTADAVLAYKKQRDIINPRHQSAPDKNSLTLETLRWGTAK